MSGCNATPDPWHTFSCVGSHVVVSLQWILVNDNDKLNDGGGRDLFISKIRKIGYPATAAKRCIYLLLTVFF